MACFSISNSYAMPSTAFFYGKPVPVDLLAQFQQVIVEPDNIESIAPLLTQGTSVFAYLSVGEINPGRPWYSQIPKHWILGKNSAWGSSIVDLTNKDWHDYLINKLIAPLWKRGYQGFFLDTLDSYQLLSKDPQQQNAQQQALINLIRNLHKHFPGIKLILNRGFELLPAIADDAIAVAAESLFQRWDPANNRYMAVPDNDRDWLLNKLKQVHEQYGLQIIVIDYVAPNQPKLARQVAEKISELGFTPWVSNPAMDMVGIGAVDIFSKRILAVYDGPEQLDRLKNSKMHQFLELLIAIFGYSFEYVDARKELPNYCLAGRYNRIVTWLDKDKITQSATYISWLQRQIDDGIKVNHWGN